MAETVGELLIKIGADLGDTTSKLREAETGLTNLAGAGEQASKSLEPAAAASEKFAESLAKLGASGVDLGDTVASLKEVEAELQSLGSTATDTKGKLQLGQLGVDVGSTVADLQSVQAELKNLVDTAANVKGLDLGKAQIDIGDTLGKIQRIEDELSRLSDLAKSPLAPLDVDLGPAIAKLDSAKESLAGLKTEAKGVQAALAPAGSAAKDLGSSLADLGRVDISGSVERASSSSQALTRNTRELNAAMAEGARVGTDLGKSFVKIATGGDISATEIFKSTKSILSLRSAILSLGDAKSAVDSVNAGITAFQKAKAAEATFGGITSGLTELTSAALKFTPAAIAGGLGVALFVSGLKQWQAEVDKTNAKTKEWSDSVSKGTKDIQDKVAAIKFDASIAGLTDFEQATARGVHEIQELGKASGAAAGEVTAAVDQFKRAQAEISFQDAARASRAAGAEISANIRKAAQDGLAAFAELEAGLQLPGLAAIEAQMASLAVKANFQPTIVSLGTLDTALDTTAAKLGGTATTAATNQEAIRGEVQKTSEFIAALPVGTIKMTLDSTEAKAAAEKLKDDFAVLAKGFAVPLQVSNADKVEALLDSLRKLGAELNFKGPISALNDLNTALETNKRKVEEAGKAAGFTEETIRKEVAKTNQQIKDRFAQEQILKVNIDRSAADAEVDRWLAEMEHRPPAKVPVDAQFNIQQWTAEIDAIRSRIVGTPDGELKIALKAKAEELQAKVDQAKAEVAKGATMPIDADTTEADRQIAEARERAAQPITLGFGAIHGEAANAADIQQTIDTLRNDLVAAIKAGDVAAQARLRAGGLEFVRTFGPTGGITASERKQILDIIGPMATASPIFLTAVNKLGDDMISQAIADRAAADKKAAADAAAQAKQSQQTETTNTLLREQNELVRQGNAGAIFSSQAVGAAINQLARQSTVQATGVRSSGSFGG